MGYYILYIYIYIILYIYDFSGNISRYLTIATMGICRSDILEYIWIASFPHVADGHWNDG